MVAIQIFTCTILGVLILYYAQIIIDTLYHKHKRIKFMNNFKFTASSYYILGFQLLLLFIVFNPGFIYNDVDLSNFKGVRFMNIIFLPLVVIFIKRYFNFIINDENTDIFKKKQKEDNTAMGSIFIAFFVFFIVFFVPYFLNLN